jgi:hypothetical protein
VSARVYILRLGSYILLLSVSNYAFVGAGFLMPIQCHLEQPAPLTNITGINLRPPNLPIIESTRDLPTELILQRWFRYGFPLSRESIQYVSSLHLILNHRCSTNMAVVNVFNVLPRK